MADKFNEGRVKMRVFKLVDELRQSIDENRVKRQQTIQAFLAESVQRELPGIAETLLALGIENQTNSRPARWPLDVRTLQALAYAGEQTGIDQNKLLLACLRSACRRGRRKRSG
jgi:hypothetical protein